MTPSQIIADEAKTIEEIAQDGELKIVVGKPPIWDEAHKNFKLDDNRTIYTYGDTIYNPGNNPLEDHLKAHEATHADQQLALTGGPKEWWEKYFADQKFRYSQELEAYQNQYEYFCLDHPDRNVRAKFLFEIARDLASGMYNAGITQSEAMKLIKKA